MSTKKETNQDDLPIVIIPSSKSSVKIKVDTSDGDDLITGGLLRAVKATAKSGKASRVGSSYMKKRRKNKAFEDRNHRRIMDVLNELEEEHGGFRIFIGDSIVNPSELKSFEVHNVALENANITIKDDIRRLQRERLESKKRKMLFIEKFNEFVDDPEKRLSV